MMDGHGLSLAARAARLGSSGVTPVARWDAAYDLLSPVITPAPRITKRVSGGCHAVSFFFLFETNVMLSLANPNLRDLPSCHLFFPRMLVLSGRPDSIDHRRYVLLLLSRAVIMGRC